MNRMNKRKIMNSMPIARKVSDHVFVIFLFEFVKVPTMKYFLIFITGPQQKLLLTYDDGESMTFVSLGEIAHTR